MDNVGHSGTLDTDSFAAAILNYRNTPDRDTKLSPSQILYARQLRDAVPTNPSNLQLRKEWLLTKEARESALTQRHIQCDNRLSQHTKSLSPLTLGTVVQVQNQRGPHQNKWDLSGSIVEVLPFDSYNVRMDGSGRITKRNRQFLKPILSVKSAIAKSAARHSQDNGIYDAQHNSTSLSPSNTHDSYNYNSSTGETADKAGRPSPDPTRAQPAGPKFTTVQLPETDSMSPEVSMTDEDFDEGLTRSVQNVLNQDIYNQQAADQELRKSKRVKFATQRLIEEV